MKKEFVTYEIAILLKGLGFNEICMARYEIHPKHPTGEDFISLQMYVLVETQEDFSYQLCSAPLWQQVIDWFREKYNIVIEICNYNCEGEYIGLHFKYLIEKQLFELNEYGEYYETLHDENGTKDYYKAREQAILQVIELIKETNNGY